MTTNLINIVYFCFFNLGQSVPSNNPKMIAYKPIKTPIICIACRKSLDIKLFILKNRFLFLKLAKIPNSAAASFANS